MRCCVSSCNTTSQSTSQSDCITFHSFPSEVHLRAAWLRALGKQDSHLPDSAVVCSQHFLNDDIYETECGLRQIVTGAIPSTVQVCMMCLDTDSKLILMNKHRLEETYEKLMGHPLCDRVNLKHTLCVQCSQGLITFRKFRDKSLRARALMMDLVDKHKLITLQHIKMINRTKHQLKSSLVLTTLGPDHCDLHILEHPSEDKQTEIDAKGHRIVVKTEESDDIMSVDGDMEVIYEEDNNFNDFVGDPLKYESVPFQCTLCLEEFIDEHAYMQHMSVHLLQNGVGDGECGTSQVCKPHTAVSSSSSHSSLITENKQADPSPCAQAAQTSVVPLAAKLATENASKVQTKVEADADEKFIEIDIDFNYQTATGSAVNTTENNFIAPPIKYESVPFQCPLCLEEFIHEHAYMQHMSVHLQNVEGAVECGTSQVCKPHTAVSSSSSHSSLITENKQADPSPCARAAHTTVVPPSASHKNDEINPTEEVDTNISCRYKRLTDCFVKLYDIFDKKVVQRRDDSLMKTRRGALSCDRLNTVSKDFSHRATSQNKVPTTEYIEPVNNSRSSVKAIVSQSLQCKTEDINNIQRNNSSQYSSHIAKSSSICDICGKCCDQKCLLVKHVKTDSEVRRFTCMICQHKCKFKSDLARHMSTHTGIKPYACKLCEYRCAQKSSLVRHKRIHAGEKPYCCQICEYKCSDKSSLDRHIRTHASEKPFSCNICNSKFAHSDQLMYHMRTHTGIKPYACELCEYRCAQKSNLIGHMRTHTGEKPYTCNICNSKFVQSSNLFYHMSTHTGIKPYACELCEYKCAQKASLIRHMRRHTGEKPYSCQICEYKCAHKSSLVKHMTTHTGNNPKSC